MRTSKILRLLKHLLILCFLLGGSATVSAHAETGRRAYIDDRQNVHIVGKNGRSVQVTHEGRATSLKTAPDNKTIAWLVMNDWVAEGDVKPGSAELVIYRNGKAASIKCTPFIRDFWFWQNGNRIAIDCGGRHFAGSEILYDIRTLKELENFHQAQVPLDKRPPWSSAND